jgi:Stealth protein CR2, conserved region 2/Stealth protein CR1, conserved region 1
LKKPLVDIVYLWVDGNDLAWREKRLAAAARLNTQSRNTIAMYGNVEGRYRDNDELRFSLRALDKFFPEHGHVYIVTDGQTPSWLRNGDGITIIDHKDLIPVTCLPTFDSGNIESYIHRIPNLSERYFYLNDDVFFGSPVVLSDWFWEDGIYVGWSDEATVSNEPLRKDANALENACRLSNQWFQSKQLFSADYQHTFRTFAHSPRPMLKSMLFELETIAPQMFETVRSTTFRVWDKPAIVSDFVMRWALATGQAKIRQYTHAHISTGDADQALQLKKLITSFGRADFFCINDTTDDALAHDPRLVNVRRALQRYFRWPSRYERPLQPAIQLVA